MLGVHACGVRDVCVVLQLGVFVCGVTVMGGAVLRVCVCGVRGE